MLFLKYNAIAAVLGIALVPIARAQSTSSFTQVHVFGPIGITTGQTIRLNVTNPGVLLPTMPTLACQLQLMFVNSSGSSVKTSSVTVAPGASASADLNGDSDVSPGGGRIQIHPVIRNLQVITAPSGVVPTDVLFCPIVPTVEIFDNATQRTQVILSNAKTYTTLPGIIFAGSSR